MTRYEIRPFIDYRPDLARIAANGTPVTLAHGADTIDPEAIRMSQVAAAWLGVECVVFPGGHSAPMEIPDDFGSVLRGLLHRLRPSGTGG